MPGAHEEQASLTCTALLLFLPLAWSWATTLSPEAHIQPQRGWRPSRPAAAVATDVGSKTPTRVRGTLALCSLADGQSWLAGKHTVHAQKPPRAWLSGGLKGEWVTSPHRDLGLRRECSGRTVTVVRGPSRRL